MPVRLKNRHRWDDSINCANVGLNEDETGKSLDRLEFEGYGRTEVDAVIVSQNGTVETDYMGRILPGSL